MQKDWKTPHIKELLRAFSLLKGQTEIGNFLRDVATIKEIESMAERLECARLLHKGWSYREISKQTGASTTTVTRVSQWLKGGEGGYKKVLQMLDKKKNV